MGQIREHVRDGVHITPGIGTFWETTGGMDLQVHEAARPDGHYPVRQAAH